MHPHVFYVSLLIQRTRKLHSIRQILVVSLPAEPFPFRVKPEFPFTLQGNVDLAPEWYGSIPYPEENNKPFE
jgi:hypothetical protein